MAVGIGRWRGLALQMAIGLLLMGAAVGTFWLAPAATVRAQAATPPSETPPLPVPTASWSGQPSLLPTVTPAVRPTVIATATDAAVVTNAAVAATVTPISEVVGMVSDGVTTSVAMTGAAPITVTGTPTYHVVKAGDTLFVIARDYGTSIDAIMQANNLTNSNLIHVGQVLVIPGADGALPDSAMLVEVQAVGEDGTVTQTVIAPRAPITERMTSLAQQAGSTSPFYNTTWLTYYGRPNIDVMGILGEHAIADLVPLLRAEAEAYERANGDNLRVMPAFHLVYGMATRAAGDDNSHLAFIGETEVISYIKAAEAEGWGVILDVQIGALSPTEAISPALKYLEYPNVHLAIDPEFAMAHEGQAVPGNPIGFVTAEQVNAVQGVINAYLDEKKLSAPRILLVHQFQSDMIVEPEKLDVSSYPNVALTLSVDGWGGPWGKISKYNSLVTTDSPFTAFKLFYRWDEPLLLPDEALGNLPYRGSDFFMDVTPNFIIYQ